MPKPKRKLTPAEKRARKERREKFMTIFINGKQKSVRRPTPIQGMDADEFIRRNADPIWLHQNEMWELMPENLLGFTPPMDLATERKKPDEGNQNDDEDIPF